MIIYSIYKATNIITDKSYIGFDSHWPKRKSEHKSAAIRDTSYNKFYNAIKKYGWESFTWESIYQSTDGDHCLNTMESYFIVEYNSLADGYNSTKGGESGLGNKWWNNGKVQVFTETAPDNSFNRGRLPFNNIGAKKGSDIQRNKHWVNNGVEEMMIQKEELPIGFTKGRLKTKAFASGSGRHSAKGTIWWNNGVSQQMSVSCPGSKFTKGRLFKRLWWNNGLKESWSVSQPGSDFVLGRLLK
jgi:group I intron endonuclease